MSIFYRRKKLFFKILSILLVFLFITTIAYAIDEWHKLEKNSNFKFKIAAPVELLVQDPQDLHGTNQKFLVPKEYNFLMTTEQTDRILFTQEVTLKTQNNKLTFTNGKNYKLDIDYAFDLDLKEKLSDIFGVSIGWKYKDTNSNFIEYNKQNQPFIIDKNGNLKTIIFQIDIYARKSFLKNFQTQTKDMHIMYNIVKP